MKHLSEEGKIAVADLASRHGISVDAAMHMVVAVSAGHGTHAQFNHPELGGMGQWLQGGMTMVGDMFNDVIKTRVGRLCAEISRLIQSPGFFLPPASSSPQGKGQGTAQAGLVGDQLSLWPAELGQPSSVGSQNEDRYAYFPDKRRLAIKAGGRTRIYDTGNHQITGFGQAQGGGRGLSFTSQFGVLSIADLPIVDGGSED